MVMFSSMRLSSRHWAAISSLASASSFWKTGFFLGLFLVFNLFISSRVELVASYQIKDKKEVAEGSKAKWTRKSNLPEVTKSWHDYQVDARIPCNSLLAVFLLTNDVQIREVVRDFQHQVLQAHEQPYSEEACSSIPQVSLGSQHLITSSSDFGGTVAFLFS